MQYIEIRKHLDVILRKKGMIIAFCLSAMLTSLALTYVATEKYEAYTMVVYKPQTSVRFQYKEKAALGFPVPNIPFEAIINTIRELGRSEVVLGKVVTGLHLDEKIVAPKSSNWFIVTYRDLKGTAKDNLRKAKQIIKHGRILEEEPYIAAIVNLRKNLKITPSKKSYTFILKVRDKYPQRAAAIVDLESKFLIELLREDEARSSEKSNQELRFAVNQKSQEIEDLRGALKLLKEEGDVISHQEEISLQLQTIADIERQIEEREVIRIGLLERFTSGHREIKAIVAELEKLQQNLKLHKESIAALSEKEAKIKVLDNQLEAAELSFKLLNNAYEETRIEVLNDNSETGVLHQAVVSNTPVAPIKIYHVGLSAILSFAFAISFAFFTNYFNTTIQNIEQAEEVLSLPLIGTIPQVEKNVLREIKQLKTPDVIDSDEAMLYDECYYALRINLLRGITEDKKIVMITSAKPGEGKSTISMKLAAHLSQIDKRVLLIDADTRRQGLRRMLGIEESPGILDILHGKKKQHECIQSLPQGLSFISAGITTNSKNTHNLSTQPKLKEFLLNLKNDYDLIIIDTPPVLAVTDAFHIATMADQAVLVFRHGETKIREVLEVKDRLETTSIQLVGSIMNFSDSTRSGGYYPYGADYYYRKA